MGKISMQKLFLGLVLLAAVSLWSTLQLPGMRAAAPAKQLVSSYHQFLIEGGSPKDIGREQLYQMYLADIAKFRKISSHQRPDYPAERDLRVMTMNVHFWFSGYSSIIREENSDAFVETVREYDPDIVLVQEALDPSVSQRAFNIMTHQLGYKLASSCASPSVHTLSKLTCPPNPKTQDKLCDATNGLDGLLLHTSVYTKLDVVDKSCLPLGKAPFSASAIDATGTSSSGSDGYASHARVQVSLKSNNGKSSSSLLTLEVVSLHLSVRCTPSKRRDEVLNLLRALANTWCKTQVSTGTNQIPHLLIAGDFNQATFHDYSQEHWQAIQDEILFGRPSDGVRDILSPENAFTYSLQECKAYHVDPIRAASECIDSGVSCWAGSLVDFIFHARQNKFCQIWSNQHRQNIDADDESKDHQQRASEQLDELQKSEKITQSEIHAHLLQEGMSCISTRPVWRNYSDHIAIVADYKFN